MSADRFSMCGFTLMTTPFVDGLDAIAEAGVPGVGICEALIPEGWGADRLRSELDRRDLKPTICISALLSPLPLVLFPGPDDPTERERNLAESIRLFGAIGAESVVVLTGPAQSRSVDEAETIAFGALARLADVAAASGIRLGLEPIYRADHENWSLVWDLPGAIRVVDAIDHPSLGITVDPFHLWDTSDFHGWIRRAGPRIAAVHVNDRGADHRSWADRRVPGTGIIDLPGMLRACEDAGYLGAYDCEIFSDNGTLAVAEYEDSLWDRPAITVVRECAEGFRAALAEAQRRDRG
jgi:sugar phosphate isomerase/epimerase